MVSIAFTTAAALLALIAVLFASAVWWPELFSNAAAPSFAIRKRHRGLIVWPLIGLERAVAAVRRDDRWIIERVAAFALVMQYVIAMFLLNECAPMLHEELLKLVVIPWWLTAFLILGIWIGAVACSPKTLRLAIRKDGVSTMGVALGLARCVGGSLLVVVAIVYSNELMRQVALASDDPLVNAWIALVSFREVGLVSLIASLCFFMLPVALVALAIGYALLVMIAEDLFALVRCGLKRVLDSEKGHEKLQFAAGFLIMFATGCLMIGIG